MSQAAAQSTKQPSKALAVVFKLVFMVLGAALIAASSYIQVPFLPVPMTLQTLAVLFVALMGGFWAGVGSVLLFIGAGVAGAPVFAGGAFGPAVLLGPTGGYLAGFVLAAAVCGWTKDRAVTSFGIIAAALFSAALVYVPGLIQLGTIIGWDKPILEMGLYPFILGDLVKALLAALMTIAFRRSFTRQA